MDMSKRERDKRQQNLGDWHGLQVWGWIEKGGIVGDSDVPYGTYREADYIEDMEILLPDGYDLGDVLPERMREEIEDYILGR